MRAPRAEAAYAALSGALNAAIADDETIGALIADARAAASVEELESAVVAAGLRLSRTEPGATIGLGGIGRGGCIDLIYQYATIEFPTGTDGKPLPVTREIRSRGVPGIEGRPVWVLTSPRDVEAMRSALEPGQVWIRTDLVKSNDWPTVSAIAHDAARRSLGVVRPPGRRKGSQNVARRAILERIRADPTLADDEIDALGVAAGIWLDALGDYNLTRQRVSQARKDAARINP